ncbi:MAG TPA: thiamine pyrophosphate-binding protein [Thermomicrobiales bacterium]|nr:thiamine pyrophosphate-binding protein [Thermomicrobiales bacterium]
MHDRPLHPTGKVRIADYLVERLVDHGVDHIFGVPGDFVLKLFDHFEHSPLTVVNTCDEQGAGFAADAYARIRGLGAVCVTYSVGGLKIANTTAQAYAEESPVIVISGAPSTREQTSHALLHHMVEGFGTQKRVFDQLTVESVVLDDPETACRNIDRAINAALLHKRPAYIEIPRDMTLADAPRPATTAPARPHSDPDTLAAAVQDALTTLGAARRPIAFMGMEVARFGLLETALRLIERTSIPTTVTPLDKSAISELHPRFIGVSAGKMSRPEVVDYVENADCLLMLGTLLTDVNVGGDPTTIRPERCILAMRDTVRIAYRTYERVRLEDFVTSLAASDLPSFADVTMPEREDPCITWQSASDAPISVGRLFDRLGCFLPDNVTVIADPGDAMFGALDLRVHQDHEFLANAFYASLGFAVPASIGAQLAAPERRPLVLVGDGAFQMTGMELATSLRYGLSPIVVILNNAGYVTERLMIDGPFNDVLPWDYTRLPELFGGGRSFLVETEADLDRALVEVDADAGSLCILDVRLAPTDASPALRRLAAQLGAAAGGKAVVAEGTSGTSVR